MHQADKKAEFIFASSDRFDEQVDRLRAVRHGSLNTLEISTLKSAMPYRLLTENK